MMHPERKVLFLKNEMSTSYWQQVASVVSKRKFFWEYVASKIEIIDVRLHNPVYLFFTVI